MSVLPKGSDVRVRSATPTRGFYFIEIVDQDLAVKVKSKTGWVYGAYSTGAKADPDAPAVEPPTTSTPTSPAVTPPEPARAALRGELKVKFTSASCHELADDRGTFMVPTLDDYANTGGYQSQSTTTTKSKC